MMDRAKQPQFWEQVRTDELYRPLIDTLKLQYQNYCTAPLEPLPFSKYKIFYETGSRLEHENMFFYRRHRLAAQALMYLIYRSQQDLEDLQDTIWAICDEYSWENPAHLPFDHEQSQQVIALSSAETGLALSEIMDVLGEALHPQVRARAKAEIERRIINNYLTHTYRWDTIDTNWSAVCAGSVAGTFMYLAPEKFPLIEARVLRSMECYLSGVAEDGACLEGLGYWNYGFGYFVYFADLLKSFTQGRIDLFQNEKVRNIAAFQHKVFLQGKAIACFSDAGLFSNYSIGLVHYLHSVYPRDVFVPRGGDLMRTEPFRWSFFIRNFVWLNRETLEDQEPENQSYYLPEAQWKLVKKPAYGFAIKGGHNSEPHNHNDVGGFVFVHNGEPVLGDLGVGEYTKDYFVDAKRYGFLVNSSRGHSVPIINGQYQQPGKEYAATVLAEEDDLFELEYAKAYDVTSLTSLKRKAVVRESGIQFTDRYTFSQTPESVVHRFIFLCQPTAEEGAVCANGVQLRFDAKAVTCKLSQETFHAGGGVEKVCYFVDLIPNELSQQFEIQTEIVVE